jgi:hypothetical protein
MGEYVTDMLPLSSLFNASFVELQKIHDTWLHLDPWLKGLTSFTPTGFTAGESEKIEHDVGNI